MSAVPSQASPTLWSSTIFPAIKSGFYPALNSGLCTYSSYRSIAKSSVFNWSSKFADPHAIRKQKALTLLFAACIGFCTAKVQSAAYKYLQSQNFKRKIIAHVLVGAAIGGLSGKISSNLIPFCQKIQTLVESNIYPVFGWKAENHSENFLPFPFNLTVGTPRSTGGSRPLPKRTQVPFPAWGLWSKPTGAIVELEKQGLYTAKANALETIADYKRGHVVFSFPYEGDGQNGTLSFLLFSGEGEERSLRGQVPYNPQTGQFMFEADSTKELPQQPVPAKGLRAAFEDRGYKVFKGD